MLCKPTKINKFCLNRAKSPDVNGNKSWIEFALLKGVSELDIFTYRFNSSVTQQLFMCATLVVLKLHAKSEMKLPDESYFLPNLKFLQLEFAKFPVNFPLTRLISGCPMLEDLVLEGGWEDFNVINISSPTLINLTLDFISFGYQYDRPTTDVLLDLPNLLHFNYEDHLAIITA
uniref:F-box/LRR-repeat protein 15/At3g58940/PEG3-like LRR domain-containing protein n=1 Tax=Chenopodium quinoa TaxID=63459 RepID=A0A803LEP7_CHEQI